MKQGINLGRPRSGSGGFRAAIAALLAAAAAGALLLSILYGRARAEVELLASDVASREALALDESRRNELSPEGMQFVGARLRLALDSGTPESLRPTSILRLVETALPGGIEVESLTYDRSPRPSLTLEASSLGGDRVTELQRRFAASASVLSTRLLEERRLPDGQITVRIQVELASP
ncbi:MAG TPA: hypothetical protein VIG29_14660 [Vicinamibacteria bacterium]|jgi:hypothetical protein